MSVGGRPWWPGAYELAWNPWLIALTGVVAAVSLLGLFHPAMPLRTPLALSAVLGPVPAHRRARRACCPARSPRWSGTLLDGPLAMLRNVHKVDPLVRLPDGAGLRPRRHAARAARRGTAPRPSRARRGRGAHRRRRSSCCCVASAQPAFTGELRKEGWRRDPAGLGSDAADYLGRPRGRARTLVLPGSGFGQQRWGWTIDEPIQGVGRSPWVSRSQVPLVPGPDDPLPRRPRGADPGRARQPGAGRRPRACRASATSWSAATSTSSPAVRLEPAPGLTRPWPARRDSRRSRVSAARASGSQAALVVYQRGPRRTRGRGGRRATTSTTLSGRARGRHHRPRVRASSTAPARWSLAPAETLGDRQPEVVTDGYRRRERQFGRLVDSLSQTMAEAEPYRLHRAAHDYPGVPGVPRTRAVYASIEALDASSSSGYADTLGPVRPELGPYSAVDGVPGDVLALCPPGGPRGPVARVAAGRPATPAVRRPRGRRRPVQRRPDPAGLGRDRPGRASTWRSIPTPVGCGCRCAVRPWTGFGSPCSTSRAIRRLASSRSARSECQVWNRAAGIEVPDVGAESAASVRVPRRARPPGLREHPLRPELRPRRGASRRGGGRAGPPAFTHRGRRRISPQRDGRGPAHARDQLSSWRPLQGLVTVQAVLRAGRRPRGLRPVRVRRSATPTLARPAR